MLPINLASALPPSGGRRRRIARGRPGPGRVTQRLGASAGNAASSADCRPSDVRSRSVAPPGAAASSRRPSRGARLSRARPLAAPQRAARAAGILGSVRPGGDRTAPPLDRNTCLSFGPREFMDAITGALKAERAQLSLRVNSAGLQRDCAVCSVLYANRSSAFGCITALSHRSRTRGYS